MSVSVFGVEVGLPILLGGVGLGVLVGWLALQRALAWFKAIVLRMTIHHAAFALLAAAGVSIEALVDGGLLGFLGDVWSWAAGEVVPEGPVLTLAGVGPVAAALNVDEEFLEDVGSVCALVSIGLVTFALLGSAFAVGTDVAVTASVITALASWGVAVASPYRPEPEEDVS